MNGELQKEKNSYVDQLPVSEIIHQVRDKQQGLLGILETHEQAGADILNIHFTSD